MTDLTSLSTRLYNLPLTAEATDVVATGSVLACEIWSGRLNRVDVSNTLNHLARQAGRRVKATAAIRQTQNGWVTVLKIEAA